MCDLFAELNPPKRAHPAFSDLKKRDTHRGARALMNYALNEMGDVDGNFVEQFQTQGFHSRIFELCCYLFLKDEGLDVERKSAPDFIAHGKGHDICLEATTTNPSDGTLLVSSKEALKPLSDEEYVNVQDHNMPIRLGSALCSKMKKRYWELDECKNKPFILAVGPYHEPGASFYSDASLAEYLYGIKPKVFRAENGSLVINQEHISKHIWGNKEIPSNFFGAPDTEFVSGVMYSNTFTVSKFLRMSVQLGYKSTARLIYREGICLDHKPHSDEPVKFVYDVNDRSSPTEEWGQGASLFLNPNALFPIPADYFKTIRTHRLDGGNIVTYSYRDFVPISSFTFVQS